MSERIRSATRVGYGGFKMEGDLSPRKTVLVLVIVVGCFAVLWPKVFYPMIVGSANQHIKPSQIDKTTGCCDVISETDVNTIKIMSELCGTIIKSFEGKPLTGKEIVQKCRQEVLDTCGIDISIVLQEQVRLNQNVKQILDEVRSLNGSLCLKYNYGVAPWRLGVPHRITVKMISTPNIRQERPLHLRSELVHPAFRERGRAIPQPHIPPPSRPPPRVVEGRPGPLPGMRPTLGGAGHVVPPSKQGTSSMSVIMPIYTIGIVIFFTYTLMRIIFKKQPEGVGGSLYPPVEPDPRFRKEVFESEASRLGPRLTRDNISSKLVVNAMSALLDEVDQEIEARRKSSEVASQDLVNGTLSNGDIVKPQETDEQPTVKVLGMETTASCEGGKKWSRPDSPVLPMSSAPLLAEPVPPPQEIYLEGALPAQSHLLVADSATEPQPRTSEDPAVVLAGKMTLSVISLDAENGADEVADIHEVSLAPEEPLPVIESTARLKEEIEEASQEPTSQTKEIYQKIEILEDTHEIGEPEYTVEEQVLEPKVTKRFDAIPLSKIQIDDLEKKLCENSYSPLVSEEKVNAIEKPLIHLESDDTAYTVKVEELEREVDNLIQEAVENIVQTEPISLHITQNENLQTNDVNNPIPSLDQQIESEEIEGHEAKQTVQIVTEVVENEQMNAFPSIQQKCDYKKSNDEEKLNDLIETENAIHNLQSTEERSDFDKAEDSQTISKIENESIDIIQRRHEGEKIIKPDKEDIEMVTTEPDIVQTSDVFNTIQVLKSSEENIPVSGSEKLDSDSVVGVVSESEKTVNAPLFAITTAKDEEKSKSTETPEKELIPKNSEINEEELKPSTILEELKEQPLTTCDNIKMAVEIPTNVVKPQEPSTSANTIETNEEEPRLAEGLKKVSAVLEPSKLHPSTEDTDEVESSNAVELSEKLVDIVTTLKSSNVIAKMPQEETEQKPIEISQETFVDVEANECNKQFLETQQKTEEKLKDKEKTEIQEITEISSTSIEFVGNNKETTKPSSQIEEKSNVNEPIEILTDDDELGSDEEIVEEIEEIVYESNEEESEEEIESNMYRTGSDELQRINGEGSEDLVEESKYTTVSGATAAENDISDEELTDNEEVDDEEDVIEVEEVEDDDYIVQESNDVNHVSEESESEL